MNKIMCLVDSARTHAHTHCQCALEAGITCFDSKQAAVWYNHLSLVKFATTSGAGDHAVPSSDCQPSLEGKFDVEITDPDIKIPNSPRYSKHLSKASRFTPHKKGISAQKPGTGSHSNQGLRVAAADKKASAAAAAAQAKAAAAAAAQAAAAAASKAAVEAASFEAAVASNAGGIQPAATATAATVGAAMEEGFDMGHEIGVSDDINRQGDGLADMGFPSATATTSPASASVATNVQVLVCTEHLTLAMKTHTDGAYKYWTARPCMLRMTCKVWFFKVLPNPTHKDLHNI